MSKFKKATKEQAKARIALFGPSGSGKTKSALRIAKGLGNKIALIDSERGSASKYADDHEFDTCDLDKKNIDEYVSLIKDAGKEGYEVLIIDSLSHAWQELLEEIDMVAKAKYRGNTWSAWSEGTPKQRKLVDAILDYPGHVIATMRSKTEWVQEKDEKSGKTKPIRVGLAPEQGKNIEYEFDMLFEINPEHYCTIIKDRTGKFQDRIIQFPDESFGEEIKAWLCSGKVPEKKQPKASPQFLTAMEQLKAQVGEDKYNDFLLSHKITKLESVIDKDVQTKLYKGLKALVERK
jgi:DNA polymerase III delta prime subunit